MIHIITMKIYCAATILGIILGFVAGTMCLIKEKSITPAIFVAFIGIFGGMTTGGIISLFVYCIYRLFT